LLAPDAEAHVGQDLEALDGDSGLAVVAGSVSAIGKASSGSVDLFEHALDRGGLSRLQVFVGVGRGLCDRPQLGEAGVALVFKALARFVFCEVLGVAHVGGHCIGSFQGTVTEGPACAWEALRTPVACVARLEVRALVSVTTIGDAAGADHRA
jgi:hypothetical protein